MNGSWENVIWTQVRRAVDRIRSNARTGLTVEDPDQKCRVGLNTLIIIIIIIIIDYSIVEQREQRKHFDECSKAQVYE